MMFIYLVDQCICLVNLTNAMIIHDKMEILMTEEKKIMAIVD